MGTRRPVKKNKKIMLTQIQPQRGRGRVDLEGGEFADNCNLYQAATEHSGRVGG